MNVMCLEHVISEDILSDLEQTCLQHLADGSEYDILRERYGISEITTNLIIRSVTRKLNAKTTYHALAKAMRLGIIR